MYLPSAFAEADQQTLWRFLEAHSFATLVTNAAEGPFASHLPLLLEHERGRRGTLVGHMARANPHWQIAAGRMTLAVFHGPHAYVSPAWYGAEAAVPTWNYAVVHARGTFRVLEDRERLCALIERTTKTYEEPRATPWRLDAQAPAFVNSLLEGIVGFEIEIERLEGKWKLSQNHSPTRRAQVVAGLRAGGSEGELGVAALMEG